VQDSAIPDRAVSPLRRFKLGDAMILVAGLAVALAMSLSSLTHLPSRLREWTRALASLTGWSDWAFSNFSRSDLARLLVNQSFLVIEPLITVFAVLTLVVPILRLRRPIPPLRQLLRQSGFVGCTAIVLFTLLTVDLWFLARVDIPPWLNLVAVVLLVWVILALPPWKAERGWNDRLGRLVGGFWVLLACGTDLL
jgi:hypothetical protein